MIAENYIAYALLHSILWDDNLTFILFYLSPYYNSGTLLYLSCLFWLWEEAMEKKSEKNDTFHTFRSAIFKDCSIYENSFEKL